MNSKRKFLEFFPIFFIGTIFLGFWEDWQVRDFIALGITTVAGIVAGIYCFRKTTQR